MHEKDAMVSPLKFHNQNAFDDSRDDIHVIYPLTLRFDLTPIV